MDRKSSVSIMMLVCLILYFQPIVISGPTYWEVYPGWKFQQSTSYGPIMFNSVAYFNGLTFQDGYARFGGLRFPGGYTWGMISFTVSSNANMTIKKAELYELQFTVDAPTGNQSVSKVKLASARKVQSVTGATSWSQSSSVITINVLHGSPADIIITWPQIIPGAEDIFIDLQANARTVFILFSTLLVVLVMGLILSAYMGGVEVGSVISSIFLVGVSLFLALLVLFMIFSAANL